MSKPPPRPALERTDDGGVRAAPAHLSSLAVDPSAVDKAAKKAKKKAKEKVADDTVTLTITLARRDRKHLRRKAERYGWTAEEAAAYVLRTWADS